jgi:hypothetical protein
MPLLVTGASDALLSFHVGAVAVASQETQEEFERCMVASDAMVCFHCDHMCSLDTQHGLQLMQVKELFGVDRSQTVKHTTCDSAGAIINAFSSCYPLSENVQCYAHIVCFF